LLSIHHGEKTSASLTNRNNNNNSLTINGYPNLYAISVAQQWKVLSVLCWKFHALSSSEKIVKM